MRKLKNKEQFIVTVEPNGRNKLLTIEKLFQHENRQKIEKKVNLYIA